MSIDELNKFMYEHGFCNTNNEEDLPKKHVADLVESALKVGRNKAIDEFAEKLCEHCMQQTNCCNTLECPFCRDGCDVVNIANEMKGEQ